MIYASVHNRRRLRPSAARLSYHSGAPGAFTFATQITVCSGACSGDESRASPKAYARRRLSTCARLRRIINSTTPVAATIYIQTS